MPSFLKRVSKSGRRSASPSAEAELDGAAGFSTSPSNGQGGVTPAAAAGPQGKARQSIDGMSHSPSYSSQSGAGYRKNSQSIDPASRTNIVAQLEAAAERQGWQHSMSSSSTNDVGTAGPSSMPPSSYQSTATADQHSKSSSSGSGLPRPPMMAHAAAYGVDGSATQSRLPTAHSTSLDDAVKQMNLDGQTPFSSLGMSDGTGLGSSSASKTQLPSVPAEQQQQQPTQEPEEPRSRPSSFYGMDQAYNEGDASADLAAPATNSIPYPGADVDEGRPREGADADRPRPSSFFGLEQPATQAAMAGSTVDGQTQAARFAAAHRINKDGLDGIPDGARSSPVSLAPSQSASQTGGQGSGGTSTRPESIAPTTSGALLDHSHLRPGESAALLSHNKTLELYRQNAKKTNDPDLIYEFAVFMIDAAKSMGGDDSSGGTGPPGGSGSSNGHQGKEETARDELVREAISLLRKVADRGHCNAQYFLGDCYANGIGTPKGKSDYDRAYPLFVLAAKHGHPDAAYRAGMSYEKGWGCRRDLAKALQFYRKAASQSHPGALYRMGTAELNGELGLKKSAREGIKWLKRSAEAATPEFPHALHELALLHERGVDNVLYADPDYACELLAQAGEMGYAPSAYKLGVNYEYGRMGCPQDPGLSIHMYNIAAQQNHREACFALTAWYLVGAPGILPQSDTEAYLWAKKAAEQGLAKAEYSVGYFTESGIGTVRDMAEAKAWYKRAADHGDKRANQRLAALGGPAAYANAKNVVNSLEGTSPPKDAMSTAQLAASAREQGLRVAAQQRGQPSNAPFPSAVDRSPLSQVGPSTSSYPTPLVMREAQTREREQAHQMAIQRTQQQQQQQQQQQLGAPAGPFGRSSGSTPSIQSSNSYNAQQRELPARPQFGGGGPASPTYSGPASPPPMHMQHPGTSSPHLMPNGRPMPPMQMRQPSGSDASYAPGGSAGRPGSINSHHSYVSGVYGAGPGSSSHHSVQSGPPPPPPQQRHMSNPPTSNGSNLAGGWNGGYASYGGGSGSAHHDDSNYRVPVIRQPMPMNQQQQPGGGAGGMSGSPQYQHYQHGPGQPYQSSPRQAHALAQIPQLPVIDQQQQQQQYSSSPPQMSDDARKKSLWKQLKAI